MTRWAKGSYQIGPAGGIGAARDHVKINAQHIADAVGMPNVRLLFQDQHSVGLHKNGQDVDIQPGVGNDRALSLLIAYVTQPKVWKLLGIRFLLCMGRQWSDGKNGPIERKGGQSRSWGGSDPWHKNHMHVSWYVTGKGVPFEKPATVDQIRKAQKALLDLGYYDGIVGGGLGPLTRSAVVAYQTDTKLTIDGIPGNQTLTALEKDMAKIDDLIAMVKRIEDKSNKTNDAAGKMWRVLGAFAGTNPNGTLSQDEVEVTRRKGLGGFNSPDGLSHLEKRAEQQGVVAKKADMKYLQ